MWESQVSLLLSVLQPPLVAVSQHNRVLVIVMPQHGLLPFVMQLPWAAMSLRNMEILTRTQVSDVLASPRLRDAGYGRDTQPTWVVGNQHTAWIAMSGHTAEILLTHPSGPILSQQFSAIFPPGRSS